MGVGKSSALSGDWRVKEGRLPSARPHQTLWTARTASCNSLSRLGRSSRLTFTFTVAQTPPTIANRLRSDCYQLHCFNYMICYMCLCGSICQKSMFLYTTTRRIGAARDINHGEDIRYLLFVSCHSHDWQALHLYVDFPCIRLTAIMSLVTKR